MAMRSGDTTDLSPFTGKWALDSSRSSLSFRSSSFWGIIKVKGTFTGLRGEAHIDPSAGVRGQFVIDASSVNTGNKKRDHHLRSEDFFAVERYPEIIFELTDVVPDPKQNRVSGALHVVGNVQPLDLVVTIKDYDPSGLTLQVETTVDRSGWDIPFRKPGIVSVSTGLEISARFNREE